MTGFASRIVFPAANRPAPFVIPPLLAPSFTGLPGQTLIITDPFTRYLSTTQMGATVPVPSLADPRCAPQPSEVTTGPPGSAPDPGGSLIVGRDGTGQAYRMSYSGANQESHNLVVWNTATQPDDRSWYITHSARVILSAPLGLNPLNVKWLEAIHNASSAGERMQWNTRYPTGGNPATYREGWETYDTGGEIGTGSAQGGGPTPADVWDGQWHDFAYAYQPNSAPGARDGITRMWVDRVLIINKCLSAVGFVPPGWVKEYCTMDELDAMDSRNPGGGLAFIRFGGPQTAAIDTPPWTMDIDDLSWWSENRK